MLFIYVRNTFVCSQMATALTYEVLYCTVVGSRRLMPPDALYKTLGFRSSYSHCQVSSPETLVGEGRTTWARNGQWILPENARLPLTFRDLLHAVNLRHGTNGFTSLPKEGVLRIFSPWKIRRFRPVLNPRTNSRPPKPLDLYSSFHLSRLPT